MDKVVFGLVGAGAHAQDQHLPNLKRAPHIFFKTVCDLDAEKLADVQKQYDIPCSTTSIEQMLNDDEIQVVLISTKQDAQADLTIQALRAGKHVYVEKPLADTVEKADEVFKTEKESDCWACVGYNRRQAPAYLKAKELILANGGVKSMFYRISDEYWRWGSHYPPGTRVIHEACHIFDIVRWFTDAEVETVYGLMSRENDEQYMLKMSNGAVITIMDSGNVTRDMPKEHMEVVVERGGLMVEEFVELRTFGLVGAEPVYRYAGYTHPEYGFMHKHLLEKGGTEALLNIRRVLWETLYQLENSPADHNEADMAEIKKFQRKEVMSANYMVDKGWFNAIEHLAICVLENRRPALATAKDGLEAMKVCHAAIQARKTGEVIKVADM